MTNIQETYANETLDMNQAFNDYMAAGSDRKYSEIAKKYKRNVQTIYTWAKKFHWVERIKQREAEIKRRVEHKLDDSIINSKADYRAEIKDNLKVIKALLATAIKKDVKTGKSILTIKVGNVSDVRNLMSAYDALTKLDLLLMGEATERAGHEEIIITVEDI